MKNCTLAIISPLLSLAVPALEGASVVASWSFDQDYDFPSDPTHQTFTADMDNTVGTSQLTAFRGDPADLDDNGGEGSIFYTSPVSGITHTPTRTIKWNDLKGAGTPFDIAGVSDFMVDSGSGPVLQTFGNDALVYMQVDGTGFENFQLRFDIEATPESLPESFDLFYRTGGVGTWFRDSAANNIALTYSDYPTPDPDNQFADSGYITLNGALDQSSTIEIILADFDQTGNGEMELDNIELVATVVPEPSSLLLLALGGVAMMRRRR